MFKSIIDSHIPHKEEITNSIGYAPMLRKKLKDRLEFVVPIDIVENADNPKETFEIAKKNIKKISKDFTNFSYTSQNKRVLVYFEIRR